MIFIHVGSTVYEDQLLMHCTWELKSETMCSSSPPHCRILNDKGKNITEAAFRESVLCSFQYKAGMPQWFLTNLSDLTFIPSSKTLQRVYCTQHKAIHIYHTSLPDQVLFERRVTWYFVWEEKRCCSSMDNKHFITLISMHVTIIALVGCIFTHLLVKIPHPLVQ